LKAFFLRRWAAWAPGIESEEDWLGWARSPEPLPQEGAPDVAFLPALQRRRCDQLSRMMLHVAHACCEDDQLAEVACVFASRHGSLGTTVSLLEDLAVDAPLSPAAFSHSVHNTQAGLFSIWARNPLPSMSVAAGNETFGHGFLEAIGMLHRERGRCVLFVTGDHAVPEALSALSDQPRGSCAVGLLLAANGPGERLTLEIASTREHRPPAVWPDAIEFVRWWLSGEPTLRLAREPRAWTWTRGAG
jgi:hypothetical protein